MKDLKKETSLIETVNRGKNPEKRTNRKEKINQEKIRAKEINLLGNNLKEMRRLTVKQQKKEDNLLTKTATERIQEKSREKNSIDLLKKKNDPEDLLNETKKREKLRFKKNFFSRILLA